MSTTIEFDGTQRFLSIGETGNHLFQLQDEPYSLILTSTSITSKLEIQNSDVEKAFEILVKHHPLAQCTIDKDKEGNFYFKNIIEYMKNLSGGENVNNLPSYFNIRFSQISQQTDWISEAYKEIKACLKPGDLPWKAVWLKIENESETKLESESECEKHKYILLFICHHSAFDGKVAFQFIVNQFFPVLNSLLKNEDTERHLPTKKIIPKSCEEIFYGLDKSVSEETINWVHKKLVSSGIWLMKKLSNKNEPIMKTYANYNEEEIFTKFHPFIINETITSATVKFCKENKISVHSFLLTVLSSAIELTRSQFPECKSPLKKFFFPIDLRKFNEGLSEAPMSLGCYFSTGKCTINPLTLQDKPEKYMTTSKAIHKQVLKQNKPNTSATIIKSLLPLLSRNKVDHFSENIASFGFQNIASLSNIGVCRPTLNEVEDRIITVDEYFFTLTLPGGSTLFVSSMNNKFMFCLAVNGHWVDEEFLKIFEKSFNEILKHVCCEQDEKSK